MLKLSKKEIPGRKNLVYWLAKAIFTWGNKHLAEVHVEMPDSVRELKKKNSVFLYGGLHKSLWEASGILISMHLENLPIPYPGMGDNLVKGKFFQSMAQKMGLFLIKRATTRREIIESARHLKNYLINLLAHGIDVLAYPEGTRTSIPTKGRYGDFFPTMFEAVLEYEKNKNEILTQNPNLINYDSYVIPFNIDYSKVREDREIIEGSKGKPRTLYIKDTLKMLKHIGPVYVSLGDPIKIADNLDKRRKELAVYTRERCLELIKILPKNIVSCAILDAIAAGNTGPDGITANISRNIEKLESRRHCFREFSIDDDPRDILEKVAQKDKSYRDINEKDIELYRLYARYIGHYFDEIPG
ncbi:MAG: hypothetical protein KAW12_23070 [Candidatus Aminicenantes bacterium]|nr:hypothetical protein [Candidatus Aminicenantes bacterium]